MIKKILPLAVVLSVLGITVMTLKGNPQVQQAMKSTEELMNAVEEGHKSRLTRLGEIADESLRHVLEDQLKLYYQDAMLQLEFVTVPAETESTSPSWVNLGDDLDVGKMVRVYLDNYFAFSGDEYHRCITVREPYLLPFQYRIRDRVQWTEIRLNNGDETTLPNRNAGQWRTNEVEYRPDGFCYMARRLAEDPMPTTLIGNLTIDVPDALVQFNFGAADIGKTQTRDGYAVTLVAMNDYTYAVEIQVTDSDISLRSQDIVGEAIAEQGDYVALRASGDTPAEHYEKLETLLDSFLDRAVAGKLDKAVIQAELEAWEDSILEAEKRALYRIFAFHGPIQQARFSLLKYGTDRGRLEHRFELPIYSAITPDPVTEFDPAAIVSIPLEGPIYSTAPALRARFTELTAEQMSQSIRVKQDNRSPDFDPGLQHDMQLHFEYPRVQSDYFLDLFARFRQPEAGAIRFYNARDELIDVPEDGQDLYLFTVNRLEYSPASFPEIPARVAITLPVMTAPAIIKKSYPKDALPDGVTIQDNMLIIDYNVFEPEERDQPNERPFHQRVQIFAKDQQQKYLAQSINIPHARIQGSNVQVRYYYGQPDTFEIWYRGEVTPVEYQADIKLEVPDE